MIRLFCLKLLLSIQSFSNPCNPVEFLILHMWLLGDSDTTRKEVQGAGFDGRSGADTGLTRQEVTTSILGLAPSTPSQSGSLRHKLILAWPPAALLFLRVQVDM